MDIIYIAIANQEDAPLPTLLEEGDTINEMLAKRAHQAHFKVHYDQHSTTRKLSTYLNLYKDDLTVFHYSGHAERDKLFLEDDPANTDGIADFLAACPKLKLVILNGCSTQGQVERLKQLATKPIIIATSAPVGDKTATEFSISFYQAFVEQFESIAEAFEMGSAAAKIIASTDLSIKKGMFLRVPKTAEINTSLWGIFHHNDLYLPWKLPTIKATVENTTSFTTNEFLINTIFQALAPFHNAIQKIVEKEKESGKEEIDKIDRRNTVLKVLPYPISEQLRKLVTPEYAGTDHIFYEKPNQHRLKQIGITYNTLIELIAFALLAQVWDVKSAKKSLIVKEKHQKALKHFFNLSWEARTKYNCIQLIQISLDILLSNDIVPFLTELKELKSSLEGSSPFVKACNFLEQLKQKVEKQGKSTMEQGTVEALCKEGEEKLTQVLQTLIFITQYSIISVKSIGVLKYRHKKKASFSHQIIRLIQRFTGLEEKEEFREDFMETGSVLLLKGSGANIQHLNLSPFIIDESAYNSNAINAKLYYFERYEKDMDVFAFKHIYKPDDVPLFVKKETAFSILKEQFDEFALLFFNQPMKEI